MKAAVRVRARASGSAVTSTAEFSGSSLANIAIDADYPSGAYVQAKEGTLAAVRSSTASYERPAARALWGDSARLVGLSAQEQATLLK